MARTEVGVATFGCPMLTTSDLANATFMHPTRAFLVILLLLVLGAGCRTSPQSKQVTETGEETIQVDSTGLVLTGFHGAIAVRGTTNGEAVVRFEKKARSSTEDSAQVLLAGITLDTTGRTREGATRIDVQSEYADATEVELVVRLPAYVPVQIEAANAPVTVEGMNAPVDIDITSGNVTVRGSTGQIDVRTESGSVDVVVDSASADMNVRLRTGNGNVNLTLPPAVSARLDAVTQTGSIDQQGLDLSEPWEQPTATGDMLSGVLGTGEGRIRINVQNGSILIRSQQGEAL